jgi:methylenetetrahydrofolate reductase (NADPH)
VRARASREVLVRFLDRPRYEVIPLEGVEDEIAGHVPPNVKLTVTASPAQGLESSFNLTEKLVMLGFQVVPHLPARLVEDDAHLQDILQRCAQLGLRDVFVIAGDAKEPAGKFRGAVDLLTKMAEIDHGVEDIGVTGYPESHPFIDDDVTIQAMWDKRHFASYIVSNVCFDPKVIAKWTARVRRRGVDLPILIGMAGIAPRAKLLEISRKIGVGQSARFLSTHSNWFFRLFMPGGYAPTRFLERLAKDITDPENRVSGVHIYTFNEVASTERWRRQTLERLSR